MRRKEDKPKKAIDGLQKKCVGLALFGAAIFLGFDSLITFKN